MKKEVFLEEMKVYGLKDGVVNLLDSYLTNREQSVQTGSSRAPWMRVKLGVPQGSSVGPLGFLIVINDLPRRCDHSGG